MVAIYPPIIIIIIIVYTANNRCSCLLLPHLSLSPSLKSHIEFWLENNIYASIYIYIVPKQTSLYIDTAKGVRPPKSTVMVKVNNDNIISSGSRENKSKHTQSPLSYTIVLYILYYSRYKHKTARLERLIVTETYILMYIILLW